MRDERVEFSVNVHSACVFVASASEFCGNRAHIDFASASETSRAGRARFLPKKNRGFHAVRAQKGRVEHIAVAAFLSVEFRVFHRFVGEGEFSAALKFGMA